MAQSTTSAPVSAPASAGKVDRRVVRTRNAIIEAFKKLLSEGPVEQITVSAIAREARVDRKTFYAHFGSIDGLMDAIVDETVVQIADTVEREYRRSTSDLEGGEDSIERASRCMDVFFEELNAAIYDNIALHRNWLEGMSDEKIIDLIREPLERELLNRQLIFSSAFFGDRLDWAISYFSAGILALYRMWATSDGSVPLDEVSQMARDFTLNGISTFSEELGMEPPSSTDAEGAGPSVG